MPRELSLVPPIDSDQIHSSLEANYDKLFAENTSKETPAEPAAPSENQPTDAGTPSEATTPEHPTPGQAPVQSEEEKPFNWDELTTKNPELLPLAKQLQADYSRKMQEVAETRKAAEAISKQFEGLPDDVRAFNDEITARYQIDPSGKLAQEFVINVANFLQQGATPAPPTSQVPQYDAYGNLLDPAYLTPEQQRIQQLEHDKARLQQQQQIAVFRQRAETEFNKLEQKYGTIPPQERKLAELYMQKEELPSPWIAWQLMKSDDLQNKAAAKAREETAAIQTQKANLAPVPNLAPNRSAPSPEAPKTLEGKIAANYDRFFAK